MEYTNDIAGRFEAAVCSLVLAVTAPDEARAKSLQEDAASYIETIAGLIHKQITDKAEYFLHEAPEGFEAYFDKWIARKGDCPE